MKFYVAVIGIFGVLGVISLILIVYVIPQSPDTQDPVIILKDGKIRGQILYTAGDKKFYAFQEIPYAAPPIGDLRFEPPQPVSPWSTVLNTKVNTKICYQVHDNFDKESEDCLYLNVYTPKLPKPEDNSPFPVMFWIHGGGFLEGDGSYQMYGPEFLIEYDVVIVTFNYRLGPFGFISTQDSVLPGNIGLKDQRFALQWVQANIAHFSGDPGRVTLWGQSAGAAAAVYHLINDNSENLFRAVILESGTALCPFAYQRLSRQYAFKTTDFLNWTSTNSSDELKQFLKNVPAKDLDQASFLVHEEERYNTVQLSQGYFYAPVLESPSNHSYFTQKTFEAISTGKASKIPVLIGINSEEEINPTTTASGVSQMMAYFDENLDWIVPSSMNIEDVEEKRKIGEAIRKVYVGNGRFQDEPGNSIRYWSDVVITHSVIKHALMQARYSDVYFYQFSYNGSLGNVSGSLEGAETVGHNAEIGYFWRMDQPHRSNIDLSRFPEQDLIMQKRLLTMWTNFVKTLNPIPEQLPLLDNIEWPKLREVNSTFLYLDINENLSVKESPKGESFHGWNKLFECCARKPLINF